MLGLTFSFKLDWTLKLSLLPKVPPGKLDPCSMKFLSPEVVPYLHKSTMCPCMEYFFHVRAGAPSCCLKLLDKLQKWLCRTVSPSLPTSLEPLAHCQNVVGLSLFYRYYFGRCSSELA